VRPLLDAAACATRFLIDGEVRVDLARAALQRRLELYTATTNLCLTGRALHAPFAARGDWPLVFPGTRRGSSALRQQGLSSCQPPPRDLRRGAVIGNRAMSVYLSVAPPDRIQPLGRRRLDRCCGEHPLGSRGARLLAGDWPSSSTSSASTRAGEEADRAAAGTARQRAAPEHAAGRRLESGARGRTGRADEEAGSLLAEAVKASPFASRDGRAGDDSPERRVARR